MRRECRHARRPRAASAILLHRGAHDSHLRPEHQVLARLRTCTPAAGPGLDERMREDGAPRVAPPARAPACTIDARTHHTAHAPAPPLLCDRRSYACFTALLPDLVPVSHIGRASGTMATMSMLGALTGFALFGFLLSTAHAYAIYCLAVVATVGLTCLVAREKPHREPSVYSCTELFASYSIDNVRAPRDAGWSWTPAGRCLRAPPAPAWRPLAAPPVAPLLPARLPSLWTARVHRALRAPRVPRLWTTPLDRVPPGRWPSTWPRSRTARGCRVGRELTRRTRSPGSARARSTASA